APPHLDTSAVFIPVIPRITAEIEAMAGGAASELSRGGMRTKIEAAKMATTAGCAMMITDGRVAGPLGAIAQGGRCSWFLTPSNPVTARKKWIAGSLEPKGAVHCDAGAVKALRDGRSLLPAGVARIEGDFARGDCVAIRGPEGDEIGRGLVAYDAADAALIAGRSSRDIEAILGYSGRAEIIHRDDMALAGE
ncbi:MAG: glutamate 5-kinase, partial [Beijerinckiaceae bacterium]